MVDAANMHWTTKMTPIQRTAFSHPDLQSKMRVIDASKQRLLTSGWGHQR